LKTYENVQLYQFPSSKDGNSLSTTRNAHTISIRESKRKRPLARHKRRFDDNIKINLKAVQDGLLQSALWCAFVNGAMEFRVSYKEGKMSSTAERIAASQSKLSFIDGLPVEVSLTWTYSVGNFNFSGKATYPL
jgi:hypothetical protein